MIDVNDNDNIIPNNQHQIQENVAPLSNAVINNTMVSANLNNIIQTNSNDQNEGID